MNRALKKILLLPLLLLATEAGAADLRVNFVPQFNGVPLVFDSLTNRTAAGKKFPSRALDFLLSDFALRRTDGVWLEKKIGSLTSARAMAKRDFTLENIPAGNYDRIRFHVGLEPQINHADAAQWPADHPLNPDVNHLYWGWSKEYVFLALEGRWQNGGEPKAAFPITLPPTAN